MALDPSYAFYSEGTISLTNGSDIATGEFVAWDPAVLPFDFVLPNDGRSGMGVIKEVLAMDQIRLAKPWTGATLTDAPYFMVRWTKHTDPKVYALRLSDYLTRLKAIPDNLEELADQINADAAAVASALATITQAASDVEADRQAVAGDRTASETARAGAEAALASAEDVLEQVQAGSVADNAITDPKVAPDAAIDASKLSYDRGVTGSIRKALSVIVGADTVNAREFVNMDGTDETAKFQAFLTAAKNKRGILPQGEIKVTSVSIDPTANFILEGVGHDPNGNLTSRIRGISTTGQHTIIVNDQNYVGPDNYRKFEKFTLFGNQQSGDGLHIASAHGVHMEDLWVSSHGGNGIYTYRGFSIKMNRCVVTQNGKWGILQESIPNAVVLLNSAINGNSRRDGYGNIAFRGSAGLEGLNIVVMGCDWTGPGQNPYSGVTITNAIGLFMEHIWSAKIEGNYAEQDIPVSGGFLVYAGPTVRGLSFRENYVQDGKVMFDGVPELECVNNTFYGVTAGKTTQLIVTNGGTSDQWVRRNVFTGTATQNLTGLIARRETHGTSAPTSGTWRLGDIVWYNTPYPGGPMGWVCTTAGTPGTWKEFGHVSA
jgi:hypothetical protein